MIKKVFLAITGCLLLLPFSTDAASLACGEAGRRQVAAAYLSSEGKQLEACFDLDREEATGSSTRRGMPSSRWLTYFIPEETGAIFL